MDSLDVVSFGLDHKQQGQLQTLINDAVREITRDQMTFPTSSITYCLFGRISREEKNQLLQTLIYNERVVVAVCVDEELDPALEQHFKHIVSLKYYESQETQVGKLIKTIASVSSPDASPLLQEFARLNLYGRSELFVNVLQTIKQISKFDISVLIVGETGTGKENTARALHYLSDRCDHGFIPINCAAIPENLIETELFGYKKGAYTGADHSQQGLVELADGGTLFLDEVDSLSAKAQAVLLRFLQTGEYHNVGCPKTKRANVHVIAATNADLKHNIEQQTFREDLFYRLNVLKLVIPPLRERPEDIESIANVLIEKFRIQHKRKRAYLAPASLTWLMQQPWPGNVRELENTLLRAFLLSKKDAVEIAGIDLQESICDTEPALEDFQHAKASAIENFEKQYLQQALRITHGNVSQAAKIAGKERRAFGKLLKKHQIEKAQFEDHTVNF